MSDEDNGSIPADEIDAADELDDVEEDIIDESVLDELHAQLLYLAVKQKAYGELMKCGFSIAALADPAIAKIFSWIREFYDQHQIVPSARRLSGKFEDIIYSETERPASLVWEDYKEARENLELTATINEIIDMGNEIGRSADPTTGEILQPRHVWELMNECIARRRTFSGTSGDTVMQLSNTTALSADYHDAKSGNNNGIAMAFDEINEEIRGMQNGHLYGFFARPGAKKTWILLRLCLRAARDGHTVLFYSPEMLTVDTCRRLASMALEVNFDEIIHASLDDVEEKRYLDGLRELQEDEAAERVWIAPPNAISDIPMLQRLAMELQANMVVIDSIAELKPDIRGTNADMIRSLMSQTKTLSTTLEVPVVFAHHQNRYGGKGMKGVAQGDAFSETTSFMWNVRKYEDTHIIISPFKSREAELDIQYRYFFDVRKHRYHLDGTAGLKSRTLKRGTKSRKKEAKPLV